MQFRINRRTLLIIPETDQDIAFIEDTMGLCEDGDVIKFERIDDKQPNWVHFRLESFPMSEESDEYEEEAITPSRACQINASKFRSWDDDSETSPMKGERMTPVDVKEIT